MLSKLRQWESALDAAHACLDRYEARRWHRPKDAFGVRAILPRPAKDGVCRASDQGCTDPGFALSHMKSIARTISSSAA
jgi:hypothetical protein